MSEILFAAKIAFGGLHRGYNSQNNRPPFANSPLESPTGPGFRPNIAAISRRKYEMVLQYRVLVAVVLVAGMGAKDG